MIEIDLPKQEDLCFSLSWKYKSRRVCNFDLHLECRHITQQDGPSTASRWALLERSCEESELWVCNALGG